MPGKINVYRLGDLGMDVVEGPLTDDDGCLSLAQNAQSSPFELEEKKKKRDGIRRLSTTASGDDVLALLSLALPEPP